jgi:hypothetical protein
MVALKGKREDIRNAVIMMVIWILMDNNFPN